MTKFYYESNPILTPNVDPEASLSPKLNTWRLVATTLKLFPGIAVLEDIKNEEVDSSAKINEAC